MSWTVLLNIHPNKHKQGPIEDDGGQTQFKTMLYFKIEIDFLWKLRCRFPNARRNSFFSRRDGADEMCGCPSAYREPGRLLQRSAEPAYRCRVL